ncbi:MAG TPA: twin-arginine translocase TatA/TatE family subunit [Blastocatellia bacterium]|jgi:sec-independent protein translocase protein TatA
MGDIGFLELLVIAVILIVLFGGRRLPELGRSLGEAIRNFKTGIRGQGSEGAAQKKIVRMGDGVKR